MTSMVRGPNARHPPPSPLKAGRTRSDECPLLTANGDECWECFSMLDLRRCGGGAGRWAQPR